MLGGGVRYVYSRAVEEREGRAAAEEDRVSGGAAGAVIAHSSRFIYEVLKQSALQAVGAGASGVVFLTR